MDEEIAYIRKAADLTMQKLADLQLAQAKIKSASTLILEGLALLNKYQPKDITEAKSSSLEKLVGRQREIFTLIGQGLENSEIAERLGISVKTVNATRDNIRRKLNVPNAYELKNLARSEFKQ